MSKKALNNDVPPLPRKRRYTVTRKPAVVKSSKAQQKLAELVAANQANDEAQPSFRAQGRFVYPAQDSSELLQHCDRVLADQNTDPLSAAIARSIVDNGYVQTIASLSRNVPLS